MKQISVRIISDYSDSSVDSWLKQQSRYGDRIYHGDGVEICYTTSAIPTDYTILINKVDKDTPIETSCVWGIQQEPFIPGSAQYIIPFKNEFAKKATTYAQCSKVFAFVEELLIEDRKFIPSPPFLYWLLEGGGDRELSFESIKNLSFDKTKEISCIANTDKRAFVGHIHRANFVNFLKTTSLPIDYYGGECEHNRIKTKLEALAQYRYSIAIENSSTPFYFTEKITDCFLTCCMPFYYGTENISHFFPKESFLWIDISKPQEAQRQIRSAIKEKLWEKNLDFILESRRRVLEDYNFVQAMGEKIIADLASHPLQERQTLVIKGYKRTLLTHLLRNAQRVYFALLQALKFLTRRNDENHTFNQ